MAITTNILRSARSPALVLRELLSVGTREDRAIAYLMAACFVIFISQWPALSRAAFEQPEVPFEARVGAALVGWIFAMPLFFYGLAAISHLIARLFGGMGTWYSARMALFWTLLVISPLMLFRGMVAGFIGPGVELTLADTIVTLAFLVHWGISLREAERG